MSATSAAEKLHEAYAAAGLTALLWGLTGIFVRLLPPVAPEAVTAGRLLVALVAALPLLVLSPSLRRDMRNVLGRPVAWGLALLLGAYFLTATAAFQMTPVAEVALLLSTSPLFVLAYRRLGGDRPARGESAGALLALAGMAVVLAPHLDLSGGHGHLLGDGLALAAAAFTAGYAWLFRGLAERAQAPSTPGVTILTFLAGSLILAGPVYAHGQALALGAGLGRLGLLLGLGVLCTAIPSLAFAFASRRLPAVASAGIFLFIPLFAALFAYVLLGEALSPTLPVGGPMVLAGLAWMLRRR